MTSRQNRGWPSYLSYKRSPLRHLEYHSVQTVHGGQQESEIRPVSQTRGSGAVAHLVWLVRKLGTHDGTGSQDKRKNTQATPASEYTIHGPPGKGIPHIHAGLIDIAGEEQRVCTTSPSSRGIRADHGVGDCPCSILDPKQHKQKLRLPATRHQSRRASLTRGGHKLDLIIRCGKTGRKLTE